jgi:hypothetical protein
LYRAYDWNVRIGYTVIVIARMPPPPINTLNCLILESKQGLKEVPQGASYYFVNSKRRFFIYFKLHEQMMEAMRALSSKGIRFCRR